MNKSNISKEDAESIMMALDQVSQTIDVLHSTVNRLKHYTLRALIHSGIEKGDNEPWYQRYPDIIDKGRTH